MKQKIEESKNTHRAMTQLFKGGRVIVAHDSVLHVLSPEALASTTSNKTWVGAPVNILLDEEVTPYDLTVVLEYLLAVLEDLPSEDVWPDEEVYSV